MLVAGRESSDELPSDKRYRVRKISDEITRGIYLMLVLLVRHQGLVTTDLTPGFSLMTAALLYPEATDACKSWSRLAGYDLVPFTKS